jgi:Ser/Thr protein kinase RdoA (MazF antagonist)
LLSEAASRWEIDPGQIRLVRDYENFVYEVVARGRSAVLRVTHCSHRNQRDLEAELDFVRFLAERELPVCQPLLSARGAWVEAMGGAFFACCFVRAEGVKTKWKDPLGVARAHVRHLGANARWSSRARAVVRAACRSAAAIPVG